MMSSNTARKKGRQTKKRTVQNVTSNSISLDSVIESRHCPKCGKSILGPGAVRLKPRPKMGHKMQKLCHKKQETDSSLTSRQLSLVHRSMQRCNMLVLKCLHCQWTGEQPLQTRAAFHRQKLRLKEQQLESACPQMKHPSVLKDEKKKQEKKERKKVRKKERKKRAASAKALELRAMQNEVGAASTLASTATTSTSKFLATLSSPLFPSLPVGIGSSTKATDSNVDRPESGTNIGTNSLCSRKPNSISSHHPEVSRNIKPPGSLGPKNLHFGTLSGGPSVSSKNSNNGKTRPSFEPAKASTQASSLSPPAQQRTGFNRSGRITKKAKETLQKMLSQQKPGPQTVRDSLSQFLNSLK